VLAHSMAGHRHPRPRACGRTRVPRSTAGHLPPSASSPEAPRARLDGATLHGPSSRDARWSRSKRRRTPRCHPRRGPSGSRRSAPRTSVHRDRLRGTTPRWSKALT
jgi:hypothetical protein